MAIRPDQPTGFRPAELQGDFFDHSEDQIAQAEALLDRLAAGQGDGPGALAEFRRIAHSLKGRGVMFEVPSVSLVAARLEDYMAGLAGLGPGDIDAVRRHFDLLDAIVEARQDMPEAALTRRLRGMPAKAVGSTRD